MIRFFTLCFLASALTVAVAQQKPTIAVFPFENKSNSAKEQWMMYGLSSLIGEGLNASDAAVAVPLEEIHKAHVDADIYPQSLFDGKITPTFIKYNLDWNAGYSLFGNYELTGDTVRISFRFSILNRKAFTPIETVSGTYGEFTDFYRTFNNLMEAIYTHMILQTDMAVSRPAIEKSHAKSREMIADLEDVKSYIQSWMTLRYFDDGVSAAGKGKYDEAIRYFAIAETVDESHTLSIASNHSNAHLLRGNRFFEQKKFDEAIKDYESALALHPRNGAAYYNLGNVFKEQGSLDRAIEGYRKAIEIDANNFEAWINAGYVCHAQGKYGEALAAYGKAIAINDSNATVHYYAGVAYDYSEDSANARKEYEKAIALDPTLASAHVNLGIILRRQNDLVGARLRYTSAITYDPNNALAHRNLGILLMKNKKEPVQALLHLERTIELEPDQPDADAIRKNIEILRKKIKEK